MVVSYITVVIISIIRDSKPNMQTGRVQKIATSVSTGQVSVFGSRLNFFCILSKTYTKATSTVSPILIGIICRIIVAKQRVKQRWLNI